MLIDSKNKRTSVLFKVVYLFSIALRCKSCESDQSQLQVMKDNSSVGGKAPTPNKDDLPH